MTKERSSKEHHVHYLISKYDLPTPKEQYEFHSTRKWAFDFAWPDQKVALEVEGGYNHGRHTRLYGFEGDCNKYNTATLLGWRVFRITSTMLKEDPKTNAAGKLLVSIRAFLSYENLEKSGATINETM